MRQQQHDRKKNDGHKDDEYWWSSLGTLVKNPQHSVSSHYSQVSANGSVRK